MNSDKQSSLFDMTPEPWEIDDEGDFLVAQIAFSEPPFGPWDYLIPDELEATLQPGMRVAVPLGGQKERIGYCVRILGPGDPNRAQIDRRRLKPITRQIDVEPLIQRDLLPLADWISDYYLTPLGSVLETIVPTSVREQAGTREMVFLSLGETAPSDWNQQKLTEQQRRVLETLAGYSEALTQKELCELTLCSAAVISGLRRRGLIVAHQRRVQQRTHELRPEQPMHDLELNAEQQMALAAIETSLVARVDKTFLLLGITGSGKTEVYIRAIQQAVARGQQAIVLVPEISLTPQTRQRFRSRFDRVAVLHSHQTAAERAWHWQSIAKGQVDVVIGARSAVFAPVPRLGLIVIDEEHDGSFKQDQQPRYHARDVAQWRSKHQRIPLILGSATPSLESYQRGLTNEYQLLHLSKRALDFPLPQVSTIDMRADYSQGKAIQPISKKLRQEIRQAIEAGGQVILLLNRRGYATRVQCPACGEAIYCPDCSIPLTHHKEGSKLVCHYCDFQMPAPRDCPKCGFQAIRFSGLGTQKLEQYLQALFPDIPSARMDTDTMRKPGSHEAALSKFRSGETKLLMGTQMIAKGLDFPNVTLVGVVNADSALHFPDFRAAERTFGLVTQVAGRSGRGPKGGRVLVQTFSPEHPAILAASRHDYVGFAKYELNLREQGWYPPFGHLVRLIIRSEAVHLALQAAETIAERLKQAQASLGLECKILGPAPAPVEKLRGKFRFHLLLLAPRHDANSQTPRLQELVKQATENLKFPDEVAWIVDVDPMDLL